MEGTKARTEDELMQRLKDMSRIESRKVTINSAPMNMIATTGYINQKLASQNLPDIIISAVRHLLSFSINICWIFRAMIF